MNGYNWGLGTQSFDKFVFFEIPIIDSLYVLTLKDVVDEG